MRYSLKHVRSSSSLENFHTNLKKQRVEMLRFSSSSSSVISGNQTRVSPVNSKLETPPLTKTSEIDEHCSVRRRCSDYDDEKSVSSSAQSDITEKQRSNLGSGSDGEKGGVDVYDSKSVRVERLKKRFNRIIVKAGQLQGKADRSTDDLKLDDSVKMQVEKQMLIEKKMKKLKETRIAAEAESKMELTRKREEARIAAEAESKMELQRKREAARKALVELERSVEVNDNIKTMKDFAVLLGYPRNSAVCNRNEIGWYGDWVVYWRRTKVEGGIFEELFQERVRRMRLKCMNMYR